MWREEFDRLLTDLGRERGLTHVSLQWLGDDPGPQLHLSVCSGGERHTAHLGDCDHHGAWLCWLDSRP